VSRDPYRVPAELVSPKCTGRDAGMAPHNIVGPLAAFAPLRGPSRARLCRRCYEHCRYWNPRDFPPWSLLPVWVPPGRGEKVIAQRLREESIWNAHLLTEALAAAFSKAPIPKGLRR
jgi:hypothetical protein